MRTCKTCGVDKPLTEFPSRVVGDVRYWRWRCRPCFGPVNKIYWHKLKHRYVNTRQESARKLHELRRLAALSHYAGGQPVCFCCDERELAFLTIDHIGGGGRQHARSLHGHLYTWLVKNDYPAGFQVLCMNCNLGKWKLGICPHQKEK